MSSARTFTITFTGDVMLARLIDQLFPDHVNNPHDQEIATSFAKRYPAILAKGNYTHSSPWGTTLPLFTNSDLNIINLETSATTTHEPWPDKKFNYRMHPANLVPILRAARVDYANLANNHVLDFGSEGLIETVWTLKSARIAFGGAGETVDEAFKPVKLCLPREVSTSNARGGLANGTSTSIKESSYPVHVYSASDHPKDWSSIPSFHLIDYSPSTRARLRTLLLSGGATTHPDESDEESDVYHHTVHHHHESTLAKDRPALKIFSVHWGPNYRWHPAEKIRSLAHFLIDECEVDIVHGHSSHHIQGVEVYHGKIIIYGCGDFVDDYVPREEFRNDLGAVWRVVVGERDSGDGSAGLFLLRLEIFPMQIDKFRAMLLSVDDEGHVWVKGKITELCGKLDTRVREGLGEEGQIIIDIVA